jgi:hypothetical protein
MAGIYLRDSVSLTPVLRDSVPTPGRLDSLVINSNGFTEDIFVGTFVEGIVFIQTSAHVGTNPTLDIDIQYGYKDANGYLHYVDSGDSFTQITTTDGIFFKKLTANFGRHVRLHFKIGGTAGPNYTVTARLVLKG